jgi:hypothetical protein
LGELNNFHYKAEIRESDKYLLPKYDFGQIFANKYDGGVVVGSKVALPPAPSEFAVQGRHYEVSLES